MFKLICEKHLLKINFVRWSENFGKKTQKWKNAIKLILPFVDPDLF